jgi:hypothetical protein
MGWCLAGASPAVAQRVSDTVPQYELSAIDVGVVRAPAGTSWRVRRVLEAANGNMFIVAYGSDALFGNDGQSVHSVLVGRSGQGPGEYQAIDGAAFGAGDTLLVHDPILNRITFFTSTGRLVRTNPVGRGAICCSIAGWYLERRSAPSEDDDGYVRARFEARSWRNGARLASVAQDSATIELTLAAPRVALNLASSADDHFSFGAVHRVPFAAVPLYRLSGTGVVHASDGTFHYVVTSATGRQMLSVVAAEPQREIPSAIVRGAVDSILRLAPEGPQRSSLRSSLEAALGRPQYPWFDELLPGDGDSSWFRLYRLPGERSARWLQFDVTGRLVRALTVPAALRVVGFLRNRVAVVEGDMSVESGIVYLREQRRVR